MTHDPNQIDAPPDLPAEVTTTKPLMVGLDTPGDPWEQGKAAAVTAKALALRSMSLAIRSADDYELGAALIAECDATSKRIDELRKSFTRPLDDLKKRWMALFQAPLDEVAKTRTITTQGMLKWRREQEEKARIEQERLRVEEDRRRQEQATIALDVGDTATAQAIEAAPPAEAPRVAPEIPKVAGITTRRTWRHRIIDPTAIPREYLKPDDALLAQVAMSQKENARVPGVEFYVEESVVRTGR